MKYSSLCSLLVGVAVCTLPAPAGAQSYIGATVAAAVQQMREDLCQKGIPAQAKVIDWATSTSNAALDGYWTLTPQSDTKTLRSVFAMKQKDVSWQDGNGTVPIAQVAAKIASPKPDLNLVAFVVAGDGLSARGLWQANGKDATDAPTYYAVDFNGQPKTMWGGGAFRIWHMAIVSGDTAPQAPDAYCHFGEAKTW